MELRATGRGQDGVRWGSQLLGKFGYLAGGLAAPTSGRPISNSKCRKSSRSDSASTRRSSTR